MAQTFCKQKSAALDGFKFPNRDTGRTFGRPRGQPLSAQESQAFQSVAWPSAGHRLNLNVGGPA